MRGVAEFMSNWWLLFIVPLVLAAIAVAFGKLLISDRKMEAFYGLAAIIVAVVVVPQVWLWLSDGLTRESPAKSSIPLATAPVAEWPKLTIPPNGKSERIPVPKGMRVVFDGEEMRVHCVYRDREESFGFGETPCASGDMPFVYASNLRKKDTNIVSYAYAPIK